jgi:PII-like signaling protein
MDMILGPARKLSAFIGESATYDDKPLYEALVESARTAGSAGATVLRGVTGFGATSRHVGKRVMRMSQDKPVVVQVIDSEGRIAALAEVFSAMVTDGLITIEDIHVVAYKTASEGE